MIFIFLLGYLAIALEHPLKVEKSGTALLMGVLCWVVLMFGAEDILQVREGFDDKTLEELQHFIYPDSLLKHLADISEIVFFLLGAMTIVEVIDQHQGFKVITDKIRERNLKKLLWIISFLTFFLSAVLDNLTTTIVMTALLRKIIPVRENRIVYISMVVIAANAGGAWSPIGDVTTIMLWVHGKVSSLPTITHLFLPSLVSMVISLILATTYLNGFSEYLTSSQSNEKVWTTRSERIGILCLGVGSLLFVPIFKTVTHLPPFMGILFGLGLLWIITEIMHREKTEEKKDLLTVSKTLGKIDVSTVLFFLGILTAVTALQTAGHLKMLALYLDNITNQNIYVMNMSIGLISAIVDNVPLVAASMGMYETSHAGEYAMNGAFWQLLAYCAGTGGSILIIGSAAGVAAMGMEKIDFIWYLRKISLLAMIGYFAGIFTFWLTLS
ncbi:MAG: sodium:proton antiporter NhaD [Nitrospinae bacterium]|nr:sodium:proton antiporter NhaD [Nitrospinota bacterium]